MVPDYSFGAHVCFAGQAIVLLVEVAAVVVVAVLVMSTRLVRLPETRRA